MKSLTIRLPDALAERLEEESRQRRISKSDVVRERLSQLSWIEPGSGRLREILAASWSARTRAGSSRPRSLNKRRIAAAIRGKKLPR
jgi:predicted transcriptional regulator